MKPTRNGKIARLTRSIREELKQRLNDGEQGKTLVAWLNSNCTVPASPPLSAGLRRKDKTGASMVGKLPAIILTRRLKYSRPTHGGSISPPARRGIPVTSLQIHS